MRGFGCIPCSPEEAEYDRRFHPIDNLVGVGAPGTVFVDHTHLLDFVPDQGPTNSCVAWWMSSAIYLTGQAQRRPVARPSVPWLYAVARYMRNPGGPLVDLGSVARLMCRGAERHGIVAESRLPFDPRTINEPPPFDADIAGADALFTGYYAAQTNQQLESALAMGHFPGIAIRVHQNFVDWTGGAVYDDVAGDYLGNHMLTLVGFRADAFLVLNSWGKTWGFGGLVWLSKRFVASAHTFERYVVTAAPASR